MTKKTIILTICLFLAVARTGVSQQSQSKEIISNDMDQVEGSGDTLWMLTSKGVNFTTSLVDNPIVWVGFRNVNGYDISFANGHALVCLLQTQDPNELWLYSHQAKQYRTIPLPYAIDTFDTPQSIEDKFIFRAVDAAWFDGAFWVGCVDGGLARIEATDKIPVLFHPGKDSVGYTFSTFIPQNLGDSIPDKAKRVVAVAGDSLSLWVVCEKALWSFRPQDTTWARINDTGFSSDEYFSCEVRSKADTSFVFVTGATFNKNDDTYTYQLYVYNSMLQQWSRVLKETFQNPPVLTLGAHDYIYVVNKDVGRNNITLYRASSSDTIAVKINGRFLDRIINAEKDRFANYDINDVHYTISGSDTLFAVATSIGLFYSSDEHADERVDKPFNYEGRNVVLAGNLKKTYAVPGIINNSDNNPHETVFAYNLSQDDDVTIDIFDYNMDHVINIFEARFGDRWQYRYPGKSRTSGRSTEPMYDRWDGTVNNRGGRVVPPGVYFYRIKTRKGKQRAFGRLIVAVVDTD